MLILRIILIALHALTPLVRYNKKTNKFWGGYSWVSLRVFLQKIQKYVFICFFTKPIAIELSQFLSVASRD